MFLSYKYVLTIQSIVISSSIVTVSVMMIETSIAPSCTDKAA